MQSQTLREILDQPNAWRIVLENMDKVQENLGSYLQKKKDSEVVFIGCGTSYYLALSAASIFTTITHQKARAIPSSDVFLFSESIFSSKCDYLAVLISRSGKTTETVWAARYIKENLRIETLALTCYPANDLVDICHRNLVVSGASEQSVVMTKSFTSMLLMCILMACLVV
ncbi:MAG: SIS domain-containing protein, partial [bacterium]